MPCSPFPSSAVPSYETFCIEQILTLARMVDPAAEAFFWRTHAGAEVDLLLRLRGKLVPIEIKLGRTVPDVRGLLACMKDLELARGFVVSPISEPIAVTPCRGLGTDALSIELQRTA